MRTMQVNVYKFDELSEKVQEKVLENLSDINTDYEWWDFLYDDFRSVGNILGIDMTDIHFSGFCSQGDGACFTGHYYYQKDSVREIKKYAPNDTELHNIAEGLYNTQKQNFFNLEAHIEQKNMHYCHENSVSIEVERSDGKEMTTNAEEDVQGLLQQLMRWMYRSLNREYDYLTSRKSIIETININEYEFTEDGRMI